MARFRKRLHWLIAAASLCIIICGAFPAPPTVSADSEFGMQVGKFIAVFLSSAVIEDFELDFLTTIKMDEGEASLIAVGDPSICYNAQFRNTTATGQPALLIITIPVSPITNPSTLARATLDIELTDNDGNGVSVDPAPPFQEVLLSSDGVNFTTSLGVPLGPATITMPGMTSLASGDVTIPAPPAGGWQAMRLTLSASGLTAGDTARFAGTVSIDGAVPACTIPDLPIPTLPIPTLPQWGMILLTLALLTLATWQLAGRHALVGAGCIGTTLLLPHRQRWLSSLVLGQGVAAFGLLLYALLLGPLVAHDGVGAFLSGILIGVMIEWYRRGRAL